MSVTTNIVCDDCKVGLWIGQKNTIYTGDEKVMEKLNTFLQKHTEHKLRFLCEGSTDYDIQL